MRGLNSPPQDPLGALGPLRSPRSVPAEWGETPCPHRPAHGCPLSNLGCPPMGNGGSEQGVRALRGGWVLSYPAESRWP